MIVRNKLQSHFSFVNRNKLSVNLLLFEKIEYEERVEYQSEIDCKGLKKIYASRIYKTSSNIL